MKISMPFPFGRFAMLLACGLFLMALGTSAAWADTAPSAKTVKSAPSETKDIAQISAPPEKESPIKFRIGVPAWASAVSGQVGARGIVSDAGYISFSSIVEKLDYVVPGSIAVDYGKWGMLVEGQYVKMGVNFSAPISGPLPGPLGPDILVGGTIEMEQAYADFNLGYKVVDTDKLMVSPFVGTRFEYVRVHGTLEGSGPFGKSFDETGEKAWADPILGVGASYQIFKPVALVAKADVGGFGAASKLTYEFFAGTRTQITRSLYVSGGYRYLSTDYSSDGFTYNVAFQGPQITFGVNF